MALSYQYRFGDLRQEIYYPSHHTRIDLRLGSGLSAVNAGSGKRVITSICLKISPYLTVVLWISTKINRTTSLSAEIFIALELESVIFLK